MTVGKQIALAASGIILLAFIVAFGVAVQRFGESRRVRATPIMMYHKIGAVTDNAWWVPTEVFERQLRALHSQGYNSILPADIVNHRKYGKRLPPRPVMLTFDDGYRDSLVIAEPLLKKYGFRAMVYLITDAVAETSEMRRQYEGVDILTWPEIEAMQQRGTFVFGGHGHRHQNLAAIADPFPDTRECYAQLRRHKIRKPFSFCYPHGQYNERAIAAVKRAGFQTGMVCEDRVALTGKAMNLLVLPRVSVMGGRHEFHANCLSTSATPGEIVVHVMHTGIPMEVSPRLMWNDDCLYQSLSCRQALCSFGLPAADGAAGDPDWLPAVEIKNADYEWHWPRPQSLRSSVAGGPRPAHGSNAAPVRLEIWDKHRLFPMFSGKL